MEVPLESDELVCVGHPLPRLKEQGPAHERNDDDGSAPPLQTLWPSTTARPAAVATIPENSIHGPLRAISSSVARVRRRFASMPAEIATR